MRGGLLVDAGDRLDLRMVGRDARADESPGRRQPLDHVDLELLGPILEQVPCRVEAGRPGADYRDADDHHGHGPTRTDDPLGVNEVLWPTELRAPVRE